MLFDNRTSVQSSSDALLLVSIRWLVIFALLIFISIETASAEKGTCQYTGGTSGAGCANEGFACTTSEGQHGKCKEDVTKNPLLGIEEITCNCVVPTFSEWGLIIFTLLLLTGGTFFILQQQATIAMSGSGGILRSENNLPRFRYVSSELR